MKLDQVPPHLLKALESDDSGPLHEIIRAHRPEDLEALRLIAASSDMSPELRRKAIYALGRWGDPNVTPHIERALPELDEGGRIAAIDALGRLGSERALQTIESYRDDPSPQVRKFVVKALSRMASPQAEAEVQEMAQKDPEEWVRRLAQQKDKR